MLPTVSKQGLGSKDWASIPSGPPHCAHSNRTDMQYEKIQRDKTQVNLFTMKWVQCDKTQSRGL